MSCTTLFNFSLPWSCSSHSASCAEALPGAAGATSTTSDRSRLRGRSALCSLNLSGGGADMGRPRRR